MSSRREHEAHEFLLGITSWGDPKEREAALYAAMQAWRLCGDVVWYHLGIAALWAEYLENEEAMQKNPGHPGFFQKKRSIQEEVAHAIEAHVGPAPDPARLWAVMTREVLP